MSTPEDDLRWLVDDLAYHQTRALLVAAVAAEPDHQRKLDGLTKLDTFVRYPALAPRVLETVDAADERLHLSAGDRAEPTDVRRR